MNLAGRWTGVASFIVYKNIVIFRQIGTSETNCDPYRKFCSLFQSKLISSIYNLHDSWGKQ